MNDGKRKGDLSSDFRGGTSGKNNFCEEAIEPKKSFWTPERKVAEQRRREGEGKKKSYVVGTLSLVIEKGTVSVRSHRRARGENRIAIVPPGGKKRPHTSANYLKRRIIHYGRDWHIK